MVDVWSPVFTKAMFGMANLRSALFRVPFLQFSRRAEAERRGNAAGHASAAASSSRWTRRPRPGRRADDERRGNASGRASAAAWSSWWTRRSSRSGPGVAHDQRESRVMDQTELTLYKQGNKSTLPNGIDATIKETNVTCLNLNKVGMGGRVSWRLVTK